MWKRDQSVTPASGPRNQSAAPRVSADNTSSGEVVLNLGTSVTIKGELSGSEDFTLHGQMEGRITLPNHTLTIGPHADIRADIAAKAVVIMGAVTGDVTAGEKVEIGGLGSVTGNITSPRLAIVDGGYLSGKVEMPRSAGGIGREEIRQ
jgi:cytoskeletal protein CcmA (bactofilin family)